MEVYVCEFSSIRNFKIYDLDKKHTRFANYVDDLYIDMMGELGFSTRTGGKDDYYLTKIMNSESKNKFEHHVEAACLSSFKIEFDFLLGSSKTIEARQHEVKLLNLGNFPYVDWEIEIKSRSWVYTIRERLLDRNGWEVLKGEKGNTLVSAYPKSNKSEYLKIMFNPKIIDVTIIH